MHGWTLYTYDKLAKTQWKKDHGGQLDLSDVEDAKNVVPLTLVGVQKEAASLWGCCGSVG